MTRRFDEDAFAEFRASAPELRFFQALREFLEVDFIYVSDHMIEDERLRDTFYWPDVSKPKTD